MSINLANPASATVAVILVNWNGWRDTVECIDSLLAQKHKTFHIFIVDNDSSDGSFEHIREWCAKPRAEPVWRDFQGVCRHTARATAESVDCRVIERPTQPLPQAPPNCRVSLIRSGRNLGFAGGCNVGIRAASTKEFDFFWFLNNDAVVHGNALDALLRRASLDPTIGMVGSTVLYYHAPKVVQARGGARMNLNIAVHGISAHIGQNLPLNHGRPDAACIEHQMAYVFGASMLVSGHFVRQVGLMQEDYFMYFEEFDWALRGRDKFALGYAADSHVFHKAGGSSKKARLFADWFFYRNNICFISRFFPHALAAVKRHLAIRVVLNLLIGRWARARIIASVLWNARTLAAQATRHVGETRWTEAERLESNQLVQL